MSKRSAARLEVDKIVKKFPDTPSRTLARRVAKDFSMTIEEARSLVRVARGTRGSKDRKHRTVLYAPQAAGIVPKCPPSLAEPWLPFNLGNGIKIVSFSDVHIPYHAKKILELAVAKSKARKPDVVLLNGDWGDYYSISRFQTNPAKRDFKREGKLQVEGLAWIRSQFPKARIVFKAGNHEERWEHYLWNRAPEISDDPRMRLDQWLALDKLGIEYVGDKRPVFAGRLPIFHGHELPRGLANPVNQARGAFLRTIHSTLTAHGHRASSHNEPDCFNKMTRSWSQACLCELHPEWAVVNKWEWGWAWIVVKKTGTYDVSLPSISIDGDVWWGE